MAEYSIAEARKHLSEIVDEVNDGEPVRITRRGKEVAVVVSPEEYRRVEKQRSRKGLGAAYAAFLRRHPPEQYDEADGPDIGPEYWDSLRDRSPGPEVNL